MCVLNSICHVICYSTCSKIATTVSVTEEFVQILAEWRGGSNGLYPILNGF